MNGFWSDIVGDPSALGSDIECDLDPGCLFGSANINSAIGNVAGTIGSAAGTAANAATGGLFGSMSTGTVVILGIAGAAAVYFLVKAR